MFWFFLNHWIELNWIGYLYTVKYPVDNPISKRFISNWRFTADELPTWVELSQDLMLRSAVSFLIVTYSSPFLSFNHLTNSHRRYNFRLIPDLACSTMVEHTSNMVGFCFKTPWFRYNNVWLLSNLCQLIWISHVSLHKLIDYASFKLYLQILLKKCIKLDYFSTVFVRSL